MKIISSFMDDISIQRGKYHAITFESSYIQSQFRELLSAYLQGRIQSDLHYLQIVTDQMKPIQGKDFYFISFDCNVVHLYEEKNTAYILQKLLAYHLEHNHELIKEYVKFNEQIVEFVSNIELISDHLKIDFLPTEKTISQFIKSLEINFEYNQDDYVPNFIMREFLIKSLLNLNMHEKEVFLLISFPETDVGREDYQAFVEVLKELKVTALILTSQQGFLTAANESAMFLIDKNGKQYDIMKLKQELLAFGLVNSEDASKTAKALAFRDFKKDYFLLSEEKREFLQSNKF